MASLNLIRESAYSLSWMVIYRFIEQTGSIADRLSSVRNLYEVPNIPNKITDGTASFPEDTSSVQFGIDLEFRHVVHSSFNW
jgi:hypothetical protein